MRSLIISSCSSILFRVSAPAIDEVRTDEKLGAGGMKDTNGMRPQARDIPARRQNAIRSPVVRQNSQLLAVTAPCCSHLGTSGVCDPNAKRRRPSRMMPRNAALSTFH